MNKETSEILQLGVVFGVIAVFLDLFLIPLPVLNWLALGVAFLFVSVIILQSVASLVPRQTRIISSPPEKSDELDDLTEVIGRAYGKNQNESIDVLTDKLRSIAINTVAAKTRFSKKEVMDLAANDPAFLARMLNDEQLSSLVAEGYHRHERLNYSQVNQLLMKIEEGHL